MTYRHPLAQTIHLTLLAYIRTPNETMLMAFNEALNGANEESLLEVSIHGYSHLIDIFHLPAEICKNKILAYNVTGTLLKHFLEACQGFSSAWAALLFFQSEGGFTPLYFALKFGNAENLQVYFEAVHSALEAKLMSRTAYQRLLIMSDRAGFSLIQDVLKSGTTETLRIYFEVVNRAFEAKLVCRPSYRWLLVAPNNVGFTPLHYILHSGNADNLRLYFEAISSACVKKTISRTDYKKLLIIPNDAGFTPLHDALISGNVENLHVYFEEIFTAYEADFISKDEYALLLVSPNNAGFTPLHQVLKSGSTECLQMYFEELRRAFDLTLITMIDYESLLTVANEKGFAPLHEVLISSNAENLRLYFDAVHGACDRNDIFRSCHYKQLLMAPNHAGYTPLHSAAISGNYGLVTALVAELEENLNLRELDCLFNAKTNSNYLPSCPLHQLDALVINSFIDQKRAGIKGKLAVEVGVQRPDYGQRFLERPAPPPHRVVKVVSHKARQVFFCHPSVSDMSEHYGDQDGAVWQVKRRKENVDPSENQGDQHIPNYPNYAKK